MPTPEATVKSAVKALLSTYGNELYAHWPVPSGFGRTTLDCLACYRGRFFSIETKAPGKKPTLRQVEMMREMQRAGAKVFVVDDADGAAIGELRQWLNHLRDTLDDDSNIAPDPVTRRPI
jgi:hypothetical protein